MGGNGGFTPRHADLLVADVDTDLLMTIIDRFLMLYIRTADRLQRTAAWVEEYDGGLDAIREVVLEDSLGIGEELDRAMAEHVGSYRDEWAATLADPAKLAQFSSFLNAPDVADPDLAYVDERGQRRPARPHERPLIAGASLEVRS